ncbi:hypothetical protein EDD85DRAFT_394248 [Armillaria nabsnona]|nr:hypothetical protein EDD85DRAFT_394248 [Armillaria nabsnona]
MKGMPFRSATVVRFPQERCRSPLNDHFPDFLVVWASLSWERQSLRSSRPKNNINHMFMVSEDVTILNQRRCSSSLRHPCPLQCPHSRIISVGNPRIKSELGYEETIDHVPRDCVHSMEWQAPCNYHPVRVYPNSLVRRYVGLIEYSSCSTDETHYALQSNVPRGALSPLGCPPNTVDTSPRHHNITDMSMGGAVLRVRGITTHINIEHGHKAISIFAQSH